MKSLKAPAVDEFRNVSKLFRSGLCKARAYYEHCEAVLGERFESIFPELLALLPDINKQQVQNRYSHANVYLVHILMMNFSQSFQELYQTYLEKHNQTSDLNNYIQVCDKCRQVLKRGDFAEHMKLHNEIANDNKLNKNFPKLSIKK